GFASHSYPNPGFSAAPSSARMGVATYRYEYQLINANTSTRKPVFLTETGWDRTTLGEKTISEYLTQALSTIWSQDKDKIVAITPFLLDSEGGDFAKFSFLDNGRQTQYYKAYVAF